MNIIYCTLNNIFKIFFTCMNIIHIFNKNIAYFFLEIRFVL